MLGLKLNHVIKKGLCFISKEILGHQPMCQSTLTACQTFPFICQGWGMLICVCKLCHHWFRLWHVTCLVPSHYLNQCLYSTEPFGTNFTEIRIKIQAKCIWKCLQNGSHLIQPQCINSLLRECLLHDCVAWGQCVKPWLVHVHNHTTGLIHKSHNAPVPYPTMHHSEQKCAHFGSEWCIVGYETGTLWDLLDRSIAQDGNACLVYRKITTQLMRYPHIVVKTSF